MKNCDEMVNSLLERREHYISAQKRKRKVIISTATSMCCVCLVALLGFGMWQGGMFNTAPSDQIVEDAIYPGIKDHFDESKGESPDNPATNNKIIVHQMNGSYSDRAKINIELLPDDFVVMDKAELNEYYGINVFPLVPEDVKECEDQRFGIYRRNGGTGEVYWDGEVLNYSNEDFSRTVNIEMKKGSLPLCDVAFFDTIEEKSIINNWEVAIGQSANEYYYAQFMYHDAGLQIIAEGLTQDEFVSIISSLIK